MRDKSFLFASNPWISESVNQWWVLTEVLSSVRNIVGNTLSISKIASDVCYVCDASNVSDGRFQSHILKETANCFLAIIITKRIDT